MSLSGVSTKEFHEIGQKLKRCHAVQPGPYHAKATCNLTLGENKCHKVAEEAGQQRERERENAAKAQREAGMP